MKQHDALPDYELTLIDDSSSKRYDGAKPNQSAAQGIRWTLDAPVCVSQIAAVRLQERDVIHSDQLAEVQITSKTVVSNGYQFDFDITSSISAGGQSIFQTPIGMAISLAFVIAVLYLILHTARIYLLIPNRNRRTMRSTEAQLARFPKWIVWLVRAR